MFGIRYQDNRIRPSNWDTLSEKRTLDEFNHRVEGSSVAVPKDYINTWDKRIDNY